MKNNKIQCACCSCFTLDGIADICPVCFWQRDHYQEKYIHDSGGPNSTSLSQARENYKKFGVMDLQYKDLVRLPSEGECPSYP